MRKISFLFFLVAATTLPARPTRNQLPTDPVALILKKNVFTGNVSSKTESGSKVNPVTVLKEPELPDKTFALLGTAVSSQPENSLAIFLNLRNKQELFLRQGEKISGGIILSIEEKGVLLKTELGDRYRFTTSGIRPVSQIPQTFIFRVNLKATLEEIRGDPELLNSLKLTRQGEGFRLTGITVGSILERLGLMNDDLLSQVNGQPISSGEKALAVYEEILRTG
ncbi:MAG: hypothetical protein NC911_08380 [Candidatus Omnitrophica bacterium]|nr:hypothetical protein [Candidatus Omnitrophota bacterium]